MVLSWVLIRTTIFSRTMLSDELNQLEHWQRILRELRCNAERSGKTLTLAKCQFRHLFKLLQTQQEDTVVGAEEKKRKPMVLVKMQRKISHMVSPPYVNSEVKIVKDKRRCQTPVSNAGVKQEHRWGCRIRAIESKWMLRPRKIIAQHLIRSETCEFLVYLTFLVFGG